MWALAALAADQQRIGALQGAPARCSTPSSSPAAGTAAHRPLPHPLTARSAPPPPQVSCALYDPWATLGVPRDASERDVKAAHRRLVKEHHPDVSKARREDPLAHAQFLRIQVRVG